MSAREELINIIKHAKKAVLSNIKTGDSTILIATESEWNKVIRDKHKKGFISNTIYKSNIETFNRLDVLKDNIADIKNEIKSNKSTIEDFSDMLHKIETQPFYKTAYAQRKQFYIDGIAKQKRELVKNKLDYNKEMTLLKQTQKKVQNIMEQSLKQLLLS